MKKFISGKTLSGDCLCTDKDCPMSKTSYPLKVGKLSSILYEVGGNSIWHIGMKYAVPVNSLKYCKKRNPKKPDRVFTLNSRRESARD